MLPDPTNEVRPSATGILLPRKDHVIKAPLARDLPCYTILVHGVNDVGECYRELEQGLCQGLNERLDRSDLVPAAYSVPTEQDRGVVDPRPDEKYFQRQADPGTWSPVIPFYWGFRELEKHVNKHERHGEWLDRHGNRLDKNRTKGGGPFSNATQCLPDMFGPGFREKGAYGLSKNEISRLTGGSPTHPLLDCPDRSYNVLAAKRLAMLITIIRNRHAANGLPAPTLNIVAHSQGTMVTLLAHAMLAKEGKPGADVCILCNATYCLRSMDDLKAETTKAGEPIQTRGARLRTLENVLAHMIGKPIQVPPFSQLAGEARDSHGLAGRRWTGHAVVKGREIPYADRDNRGKVYLYFCPEDLTVALPNIQGIGWCGVEEPDRRRLPAGFRQRVWTMLWRDGKACKVGQGSGIRILRGKDEDFWNWADDGFRAEPEELSWRWINGEELPVPFEPRMRHGEVNEAEDGAKGRQGKLMCSPLDACVAVSHKGIGQVRQAVMDPRRDREPIPKDTDTGGPQGGDPAIHWKKEQLQALQDHYDRKLLKRTEQGEEDRTDQFEVQDAYSLPDGRLMLIRSETANEARKRWQSVAENNSYHSAIVSCREHHRQATAYDLAVGLGSGSGKKWMRERTEDDQAFLKYLCAVADWRIKEKKREELTNNFFFKKEPIQGFKNLMEATIHYFNTGNLPYHLLPNLADLSPIIVDQILEDEEMARERQEEAEAVARRILAEQKAEARKRQAHEDAREKRRELERGVERGRTS
ncbi:MAG TPA: DUF3274 domain-containing protein [Holophaga sp.]|nr:DUF3274 domain-containing protein [Holophaga sp.]